MPYPNRPRPRHPLQLSLARRASQGQEEGVKDRPCAIVLAITNDNRDKIVTVLPITHAAPRHTGDAIEIPPATKRRLGLDDERSWVVLTEANRFFWPGPDLRPARQGDAASVAFGLLPEGLFEESAAASSPK